MERRMIMSCGIVLLASAFILMGIGQWIASAITMVFSLGIPREQFSGRMTQLFFGTLLSGVPYFLVGIGVFVTRRALENVLLKLVQGHTENE